jgi:two-component system, OmpR family, alkaline phosphatase synthesis response regulator PhoP
MAKKILVADDSNTALMMERTLLARSAYDVVVARDGREAVKQAIEENPDLIILDVVMPAREPDGIEFLFRLRRKPNAANIHVMVISGLAGVINPQAAGHLGVRSLHPKPIATDDLLEQIKSILTHA